MRAPSTIHWGILGCGRIARKFVTSARSAEGAEIAAVASETPGKAAAFAAEFEIAEAHESYAALLENPAIDAVYVANTHNFHHRAVCQALRAGKAVLCEKPLAVNAPQAREMIALAREGKRFLMEGMWTRFLPALVQARRWIADGRIGAPRQVRASFGFRRSFPPEHRMVNPALAGGALLDLGIYPLALASMVAGGRAPISLASVSRPASTGVDLEDSLLLEYPDGLVAHLDCGFDFPRSNEAVILGEEGSILLPDRFFAAQAVQLQSDQETLSRRFPFPDAECFRFEIEAVNTCLRAGETESALMPLKESLILAQTMDRFRALWGLSYPGESVN